MLKAQLRVPDVKCFELAKDKIASCIAQINALNPPKPVNEGDVEIREYRIVGDALTMHRGKFRTEDMEHMLKLMNGAPMLAGHDTDKVPLARFFGGRTEKIGDVTYAIPMFYWANGTPDSDRMEKNIDTGIYNEGSIGFRFTTPTCNICGLDIRGIPDDDDNRCIHIPGRKYDGKLCFYYWDGVTTVDEGSIVYRGSHPGTGMGKPDELQMALSDKAEKLKLNLDKKTDKSGGKMELVEILQKLAENTGIPIDGLTDTNEMRKTLELGMDELKANADIGVQALTSLRKDVEKLAQQRATLTGREVTETQKTMIKNADWDTLRALQEDYQADLDISAGQFTCTKCGEPITELRQSQPVQHDNKDGKGGISIPLRSI